ncbi:MAG: 3-phosphoshikimate 1-carboxyvinyltransferase [Odoribacter sp.]|nr:3-phosphoshikimate 1-carboxyvinyltransferase [Odoribacter sp.]
MRIEATATAISGIVYAPSSKSAMQRIVAGALLAEGVSQIFSPSFCDDSLAAIAIAEALGAEATISDDHVVIRGGFSPHRGEIFCGESGLATRMFSPIAALYDGEIIINGKGSILKRPLKMMEGPLKELGVRISTNKGFLPVKLRGPLKGGDVFADGSVSSQFITGLLMALPVVQDDSLLIVDSLVSRPYIDLTISILDKFGINISNHGYEKFEIAGRQKYIAGDFTVEGDWSGASFLMVMAAIGGEAVVKNLDIYSTQADKTIFDVLSVSGAKIKFSDDFIIVSRGDLHSFSYDISDCPDLAPPLVVLALACSGRSILTGTSRLISKESDRGKILEATLSALGGKIKNYHDRIEIDGGVPLNGGVVSSHNDHRIAMALTTASLLCSSPVIIDGIECIKKSYPDFTDDFRKLGGRIKLL